jgi:hypothetical protein
MHRISAMQPKHPPTKDHGQGQSGYAAGRVAGDPALDLEGRTSRDPNDTDERTPDRGDTGRGRRAPAPADAAPEKDRSEES